MADPAPQPSLELWNCVENVENLELSTLDKWEEEEEEEKDMHDSDDVIQDTVCKEPTLSEKSSFSSIPDDISPLIEQWQPSAPTPAVITQSAESVTEDPSTSSSSTLGKRTASQSSLSSDTRAFKAAKLDVNASEETSLLYTPVVVAYSRPHQHWIDVRKLPWGVQWEIARLVSINKISYSDIHMDYMDRLQQMGNNATAAPLTERIMSGNAEDDITSQSNATNPFANEIAAKFPWHELDKEECLLKDNPYAGLGFNENSDWFGGKVVFRGKLRDLAEAKSKHREFKVVLERAELGASSRFTRRFGSASFFRVKIPKFLWKFDSELMNYFRRPFIISGRVFRAFLEKEKNVFFFMTDEAVGNNLTISNTQTISGRLSFWDFLNWHNPIQLNKQQSAAKYASRFALGLSTSAPGLKLLPENVFEIEDIVSTHGSDMTDGAGFMNKAGLHCLFQHFLWDHWPTGIQCRIAGAKGMLQLHPTDSHSEPRVWLRPSMIKISYNSLSTEPALSVIDLVRSCHPRFGSRLSAETIINLADNGVPKDVFFNLLQKGLATIISSLTTWDESDSMYDLWVTLSRVGGVFAARSARYQSGLARVKGHAERDAEVEEDEDGLDEIDNQENSVAWWSDAISGQPSSLEETVMYLADAGFHPATCPVMRDKLKRILSSQINAYINTFRIDVPLSFTAFILPDPEGVLEEGEVYFKSSHRDIVTKDEQYTDVLIGDVLVTRHPCKLPTDVQKWKAVDKPELRHYTDVLLLSTKGLRRAADWIGGGDYDGDKGLVIHQPEVVDSFRNAPLSFGDPRDDIKTSCFSRHTETVSELLERCSDTKEFPLARIHALQEYLLGGIKTTSLVGQVSNMHDYAIYTLGYRHSDTVLLAHMFCHTLDGAKTGLKVLPEVWTKYRQTYDKGPMHWKRTEGKSKDKEESTSRVDNFLAVRPSKLGSFIMDQLKSFAKRKGDEELGKIENTFNSVERRILVDDDLARPWKEAEELAHRAKKETGSDRMLEDLKKIEEHVRRMYHKHREQIKQASQKVKGSVKKGAGFSELPIETRQDLLRSLSREFAGAPAKEELLMEQDQVLRLKASYAYLCDHKLSSQHWTRFPWDVTMRELCAIKAKSSGRSKTVQGDFYERFHLKMRR